MTTEKKNKPTHVVYYVTEGEDAKWTRIGAAWQHEDTKGLTVQLDAIPLGFTGRMVLREPKPKHQESGA